MYYSIMNSHIYFKFLMLDYCIMLIFARHGTDTKKVAKRRIEAIDTRNHVSSLPSTEANSRASTLGCICIRFQH